MRTLFLAPLALCLLFAMSPAAGAKSMPQTPQQWREMVCSMVKLEAEPANVNVLATVTYAKARAGGELCGKVRKMHSLPANAKCKEFVQRAEIVACGKAGAIYSELYEVVFGPKNQRREVRNPYFGALQAVFVSDDDKPVAPGLALGVESKLRFRLEGRTYRYTLKLEKGKGSAACPYVKGSLSERRRDQTLPLAKIASVRCGKTSKK